MKAAYKKESFLTKDHKMITIKFYAEEVAENESIWFAFIVAINRKNTESQDLMIVSNNEEFNYLTADLEESKNIMHRVVCEQTLKDLQIVDIDTCRN